MSYEIAAEEMPVNWEITKQESDGDEVYHKYQHEHLDVELTIIGERWSDLDQEEPIPYNLLIMATEGPMMGVDYDFETAEEITNFENARDYALALMEWMEQEYQAGEEDYVQAALHQVNPARHRGPQPSGREDTDWDCPECGADTVKYRGMRADETMQNHFNHMEDEAHDGWSVKEIE